jgi:hypothetical protein
MVDYRRNVYWAACRAGLVGARVNPDFRVLSDGIRRAVKAVSWTNRLKTGIISCSIGAASMCFHVLPFMDRSDLCSQCARSSMDRVLPSEGRGCWFDPSRAHQDTLAKQGLTRNAKSPFCCVRNMYGMPSISRIAVSAKAFPFAAANLCGYPARRRHFIVHLRY